MTEDDARALEARGPRWTRLRCRWCRADYYRRQHASEGGDLRCTRCGEPLDQEQTGPTLRPWTPVVGPGSYERGHERDDCVLLQLLETMICHDFESRTAALFAGEVVVAFNDHTTCVMRHVVADIEHDWDEGLAPTGITGIRVELERDYTTRHYGVAVWIDPRGRDVDHEIAWGGGNGMSSEYG